MAVPIASHLLRPRDFWRVLADQGAGSLLNTLQDAVGISTALLDAARQGDWDRLPELESQRAKCLDALSGYDLSALGLDGRVPAAALLRACIDANEAAMALTRTRMALLQDALDRGDYSDIAALDGSDPTP